MEEADAIYFCGGFSNGCRIEHEIANLYGLRILNNEIIERIVKSD